MQKHYWTGICAKGRQQAIEAIAQCVNQHGTILNSTLLSDIALNLVIEVDPGKIAALYSDLGSLVRIDGADFSTPESQTTSLLLMSITFTEGSGDLRLEIPDVPG